jgi:Uma2 family endonuclease
MNPVEYLAWEIEQETRHELVDGYLYAMTGASLRHDEIAMNIAAALHTHLKGTPCRVYKSDIKIRVANDFYYPDITVRCGRSADQADQFSLSDPQCIIEVLSPSTQRFDRGDKRLAYQQLSSLREYILVSQDEILVEHFVANLPVARLTGTSDTLDFASLDFSMTLEEIYA